MFFLYLYLEKNFFIPLNEVIAIVEYNFFYDTDFFKYFQNKNRVISLTNTEKKSVVITDDYIYLSSYTLRALNSHGNEFKNIKKEYRQWSIQQKI